MKPRTLTPLVVAGLLALGACSGQASPEQTNPNRPSEASASAAPSPTRYTDRELVDALPRTSAELHEVRVREQCHTMNKPCGYNTTAGAVYVYASNHGPQKVDLAVRVTGQWRAATWKDLVHHCPQGQYERPLRWRNDIAKGAYEPGERGTSKRTPWTVDTWEGFICEKDGVSLWPHGKQSKRHEWESVFLNNGFHMLVTEGCNLAETKALASEYLDRLEAR
jgi:hypothetical protein